MTNNKAASTSNVGDYVPARFYKSSDVSIEYPGMTKLVIETTAEKYASVWADSYTGSDAAITVDGQIVTIKFSAPTDTFSLTNLSAQTRVNKISVFTGPDEEIPPHEHSWTDATCTVPKTCAVCGATEGDVAEHSWINATCTAPKTCSTCELTEGEALRHNLVDGVCSVCGKTPIASGTCGDSLTWTLDSDGVLTIYGTGPMYNYYYSLWGSEALGIRMFLLLKK